MKFQVRFDGPPGPVGGRFIETEDENGRGIGEGMRWVRDGKDWLLVIDIDEVAKELAS